jgi:hypothetical protein
MYIDLTQFAGRPLSDDARSHFERSAANKWRRVDQPPRPDASSERDADKADRCLAENAERTAAFVASVSAIAGDLPPNPIVEPSARSQTRPDDRPPPPRRRSRGGDTRPGAPVWLKETLQTAPVLCVITQKYAEDGEAYVDLEPLCEVLLSCSLSRRHHLEVVRFEHALERVWRGFGDHPRVISQLRAWSARCDGKTAGRRAESSTQLLTEIREALSDRRVRRKA